MKLRDYQKSAVDAAITHMRRSTSPGLIEAATGAGKSLIAASIADWLNKKSSGKKILVLAPSRELIIQNYERYLLTGADASIFCASAGSKCLQHPVIFCSPVTTINSLDLILVFPVSAIIIDEAHGISATIKTIIQRVKDRNPHCRVIGMTATPYRIGTGRIYGINENDRKLSEEEAIDPFFEKLIYKITAPELISSGFLSPPAFPELLLDGYNAAGLKINSSGKFDNLEVEQCFEGKGRLTASIVADIVDKSTGRNGVIIFAATIQHAHEVLESCPIGTQIITGSTPKRKKKSGRVIGGNTRDDILDDFKDQRFKILINVAVLTTGVDAPHVDVIAILRATESAGLFMQIIGRGMRLYPAKQDFLLLDYADNLARHDLSINNLFNPKIETRKKGKGETIPVPCPVCDYVNEFALKPNPDNFPIKDGYFTDLEGEPLETAHFGRRCRAEYHTGQCTHFFVSKPCPACEAENDIAARFCSACNAELVDPNENLDIVTVSNYTKIIPVLNVLEGNPYKSKTDKMTVRVDFRLMDNTTMSKFYSPESEHPFPRMEWREYKKIKANIRAVKLIQDGETWKIKQLLTE